MATKRKNAESETQRKFMRPRPVFDNPIESDFKKKIAAVVKAFDKDGSETNLQNTLEQLMLGLAFHADHKGIDFKELCEWTVSHWHVTRWYGGDTTKICETDIDIGPVD